MEKPLTLTTYVNGRPQEWITIVENGIPVWTARTGAGKTDLLDRLNRLFEEALTDDDEPVVEITAASGKRYEISFFEQASLYLCEDLEGRYSTLSTLCDAIWELISDDPVKDCRIL